MWPSSGVAVNAKDCRSWGRGGCQLGGEARPSRALIKTHKGNMIPGYLGEQLELHHRHFVLLGAKSCGFGTTLANKSCTRQN